MTFWRNLKEALLSLDAMLVERIQFLLSTSSSSPPTVLSSTRPLRKRSGWSSKVSELSIMNERNSRLRASWQTCYLCYLFGKNSVL